MLNQQDVAINEHLKKLEDRQREKEKHRERRKTMLREKERLEELRNMSWMTTVDRGNWLQRCYRGKRSAYLKRQASKAARRYEGGYPPKGNVHRKTFDYWWELI